MPESNEGNSPQAAVVVEPAQSHQSQSFRHPSPAEPDRRLEDVLYEVDGIEVYIDEVTEGLGHLFVTDQRVLWISSSDGRGIWLDYLKMPAHAMSRGEDTQPADGSGEGVRVGKCVWLMYDNDLANTDDENGEEIPPTYHIQFVPRQGPDDLQAIYDAMSVGQSRNPDPMDDMVEAEDEEQEEIDIDEVIEEAENITLEDGEPEEDGLRNGAV